MDPVSNYWPCLDHKIVIHVLLVRCLLYFIEVFYLFSYCVPILHAQGRKDIQTDCLLILLNAFRKSQDFSFPFYPAGLSFSITTVSIQIIITSGRSKLLAFTNWKDLNFQQYVSKWFFSFSNACNQTEAKAEYITCGTSNFSQKNATVVILGFKWDGRPQNWLPEVKEKILNIKILH